MNLKKSQPIYDFFTADHRRLDTLFEEACADIRAINLSLFHEFRVGLLTHIKMEEKTLFVAAQKANGGEPLPLQAKLRLDHGAITALLVCYPSPEVVKVIAHILELHDYLEEKKGGMYEACEQLAQSETEQLLTTLHQVKPVPVHPFNEADYALDVAKRAVARAGFDFDKIVAG